MELNDWPVKFLKKFFAAFRRPVAKGPSPVRVEESCPYHLLSRYIFQSGHFNIKR